jgi:hypothetical protein
VKPPFPQPSRAADKTLEYPPFPGI